MIDILQSEESTNSRVKTHCRRYRTYRHLQDLLYSRCQIDAKYTIFSKKKKRKENSQS
jgi:hypothetical protein